MVMLKRIILKKGFIRKPGSNRQIKLLGKTHIDLISREKIGSITRRRKIKKLEYIRDLWNGDLKAVSGLVDIHYKFKERDIRALNRVLLKDKYKAHIHLNNGVDKWVTLTLRGLSYIKQILTLGYHKENVFKPGSDILAEISISGIKSMEIEKVKPGNIMNEKNGKLFKYINVTELNLERYQILSEKSDISITKNNCLIYALRQQGVEDSLINAVKSCIVSGSYISVKDLKKISEIMKTTILLHKFRNKKNKIVKSKIGNFDRSVKIAIYKNHYFAFEDTKYTTFSIRNYNKLNSINNFNNIIRIKNLKPVFDKEAKRCNSLNMIRYMMENDSFDGNHYKLDKIAGFRHDDTNTSIPLDNIQNEQKEYMIPDKKQNDLSIFYADTESLVNDGEHLCMLTGIIKEGFDKVEINTYDENHPNKHVYDMLDYANFYSNKSKKIIIYFHNLKYDWAVLKKHVHAIEFCEKDGQIYSVTLMYGKRKFELRDSYKLFNEGLSKFCETFSLDKKMNKKEAIGYGFYNKKNIKKKKHLVSEYLNYIKESDKKLFIDILKEDRNRIGFNGKKKKMKNYDLFRYDGKYFDAMRYYKHYLKYDCLVLMNGFKIFEKKIKDITGLRIHDSLTISSLANKFFANKGSFDGLYQVSSNLRAYLSKAIVGGRCTVLESVIKKRITKWLVDYDACSLYPSAIYRICMESGLPRGMAKRISGYDKKYLDEKDYYVVTVRINKINKKQQIPFISMKDNSGILQYINEVPTDGLICVVDQITLNDYIKFHKIEYEILDGVYWDEGFNKTFGNEIKKLYNKRLIEKAISKNNKLSTSERNSGGVMQKLIKLMLNSAYGKTIIKKTSVKKLIKTIGPETDSFIFNNFNVIREIEKISDRQCVIKTDTIDDTYNLAHVGSMVLSMSKRIMNEVMGVANDNGIKVYYQDTDSIHTEKSQINNLERLYHAEYNRVLNGKMMGNFHSDFDLKGSDKDIYSTESYFLGKKCYIDRLECINKDKSIVHGYHIRLKGVTDAGIKHTINNKFKGDAMKMFKYLSSGKSLKIPLNPKDSVSMCFTGTGVYNRETETFCRTIGF